MNLRNYTHYLGSNNNPTRIYYIYNKLRWINLDLKYKLSSLYLKNDFTSLTLEKMKWWHFPQKIYVDPFRINKRCASIPKTDSLIMGGGWDIDLIDVSKPIVKDLLSGVDYKDTSLFAEYKMYIRDGSYTKCKGLRSAVELDKYFKRKIKMIDELARGNFQFARDYGMYITDDVTVFLTRDGELILGGAGAHRLEASKLLKYKKIPVFVKMLHAEFWSSEVEEGFKSYKDIFHKIRSKYIEV